MAENETSGVLQNDSPTARVPGAAPGDSFRFDMPRPTTPDSSKRSSLQVLITLIRKKPYHSNPMPPRE
jgi:hypothetical protein